MTLLDIAVLALVQGITEFLPISSHAHLRLVTAVTGMPDPGLIMYVAVHVGTLGAVMLYFRRDVWLLLRGLGLLLRGRGGPPARLLLNLVAATLPVIGAGYLVERYGGEGLYTLEIIAWTTLGFGILLYLADRFGMTIRRVEHMGAGTALAIGLAQVLALVPGTSRSGVTMTMARILGFERREAARFSLLMSMPAILGAGVLQGIDLYRQGDVTLGLDALIAAGLAFLAALVAIAIMMRWLERARFTPFAVYRLLLGAGLLYWVYA